MASKEGVEAKIQAKGNGIVEATLKIVKNGSYSFSLGGGTALYITVDVSPCLNCQQTPHSIPKQLSLTDHLTSTTSDSTEQFTTTDKPFLSHHDSICASTFEPDNEPIISKGFEESEEVDPEKSRLVCSDNYTAKPQETSKKKKKK